MQDEYLPIIDSHIHLYPKTHISRLAWTSKLPADHILNQSNSVTEYRAAAITSASQPIRGFIFLETDRISGEGVDQWTDALEEVKFLVRVVKGRPVDGEGHDAADSDLVLGIVPWAPIVEGPTALEEYVALVKRACTESGSGADDNDANDNDNDISPQVFTLVRGFRYLLQDKPQGTMGRESFIAGLSWLARKNFTFDLGIDLRSGGTWQLDEAKETCDKLDRLTQQNNVPNLTLIINHFCKPNLRISFPSASPTDAEIETQTISHPDFITWKHWIRHFAARQNTYMKLSGFFSELPEQRPDSPTDVDVIWRRVKPWVDVVFDEFGPGRIMFGSDWPVCGAGGLGKKAWRQWRDTVALILEERNVDLRGQRDVWAGTAVRAYGLAP